VVGVGAELRRVRDICLALPEVTERLSHGAPTWFAGKKAMVIFMDHHHDDGRLALWVAAPSGAQADMMGQEPERFFVPPYVGTRGWLGVRLDRSPDWDEVADIVEEAYRTVAIKRLLTALDGEVQGER
jgi:hypothetical protein